jgi:hypothetical protein
MAADNGAGFRSTVNNMNVKTSVACFLTAFLVVSCDSHSVRTYKADDSSKALADYMERLEVWDKLGDHVGRYQFVSSGPDRNYVVFDTSSGRVFAATNGHWQMILDIPEQPPGRPKELVH